MNLKRRTKEEIIAHYDGQIAACECLLKMWPVDKEQVQGLIAIAYGMKQYEQDS